MKKYYSKMNMLKKKEKKRNECSEADKWLQEAREGIRFAVLSRMRNEEDVFYNVNDDSLNANNQAHNATR